MLYDRGLYFLLSLLGRYITGVQYISLLDTLLTEIVIKITWTEMSIIKSNTITKMLNEQEPSIPPQVSVQIQKEVQQTDQTAATRPETEESTHMHESKL